MHGYTYSNNSPITFSDPSGMWLVGGEDPYTGNQYGVRNNSDGSQTQIGTPPASSGSNGRGVNSRVNSDGGGYINGIRVHPQDTRDFTKLLAVVHDENLGKRKVGYDIHGSQASRYDTTWMIINACGRLKNTSAACSKDFLADIERIKFSSPDFPGGYGRSGGSRSAASSVAKQARKLAKKAGEDGCSFTGETAVVMADGSTKPIAEVKAGDQVLASNPETGEKGARTVTAVKVHDDTVQDLALEDGSRVTTTFDHPLWNETDREWQWAEKLDRGDSLLSANGERVKVAGMVPVTSRWAPAYDLTVAELQSYFVVAGQKPVLVHNCPMRIWRVGNGNAEDSKQDPVSPDQWILSGEALEKGSHFFVVMPDWEVRAFPHPDYENGAEGFYPGHSSLSERKDVIAAGEFQVDSRGVITEFSNFSGHYHPDHKTENIIRDALDDAGFDLSHARWTPHAYGK
jgi:hypothetical protein